MDLDDDRSLVVDGRITTGGAGFTHIDVALALVARRSPGLAEIVSRYLVAGQRPAQSSVAITSVMADGDPLLVAFERHLRDRLDRSTSIARVAHAIGTSERTLQRRCAEVLGMTPVAFLQRLRVDRAASLLRNTDHGMHRVAQAVGYRNASTRRELLRREGRL